MDLHGRLTVRGCRKHFRLLGRDRCIGLDQVRHNSTHRFDTERQGCDVEEEDILHFASEYTALDGCTNGDHLVRVHTLGRLTSEKFLYFVDDARDARRPADENYLVDLRRGYSGVCYSLATGLQRALDQVVTQLFELGATQFL